MVVAAFTRSPYPGGCWLPVSLSPQHSGERGSELRNAALIATARTHTGTHARCLLVSTSRHPDALCSLPLLLRLAEVPGVDWEVGWTSEGFSCPLSSDHAEETAAHSRKHGLARQTRSFVKIGHVFSKLNLHRQLDQPPAKLPPPTHTQTISFVGNFYSD